MNAEAFLDELNAQGIRHEPPSIGNLYAALRARLTAEQIRQHKPALLAHFHAKRQCASVDEALALLQRVKCYTVPAGRMRAAREIAERRAARLVPWNNGEPISEPDDAASILTVLRDMGRELIAIGGSEDPELAETAEMVERAFPGARLVKIQ